MVIINLFDGPSVGKEACLMAGVPITSYYASEIDPYAIKISQKNHPDVVQLGDVSKIHITNLGIEVDLSDSSMRVLSDKPDLLLAGSPCQGFSFAGKQLNFNDPRSKLFFEFARILEEAKAEKPDIKFVFENVMMRKEFQDVISQILGVDPIAINANLVSAQHRKRLFWTNIEGVTQPKDEGIFLRDILERNVADKYFLSAAAIERLNTINKRAKERGLGYKDCILLECDKFLNLDANFFKGPDGKRGVIKHHDGRLRMPTPLECERLQSLPDNYTQGVSDTQRYKLCGNGWNKKVIAHILSFL